MVKGLGIERMKIGMDDRFKENFWGAVGRQEGGEK